MNEEQLIVTLQACYFGDRGAFNKILKEYKNLQTENQQLKHTWNDLKGWLKANDIHYAEAIPFRETLRKMQELEKESDIK